MSIEIIAEIGSCHEGELDTAIALAGAAVDVGASCIKLQWWSSPARMVQRRHVDPESGLAAAYKRLAIPFGWLDVVGRAVRAMGAKFGCSVYLPEDVQSVADYVDFLKVSSFEANDPGLLTAVRLLLWEGKEVVVSLGMGARRDVLNYYLIEGPDTFPRDREYDLKKAVRARVKLLYCVSAYPSPLDQLHLPPAMAGFSDHSAGDVTLTGALAVARGATVLERHVRLDATPADNPDYPHAMAPGAFAEYVRLAREAEVICAQPDPNIAGPAPCEESMLGYRVL